jgi:monoamine oxidase
MSRSALFAQLAHLVRIARYCDQQQLPTTEGVERYRALHSQGSRGIGRREWLARVGRASVAGAVAGVVAPARPLAALIRSQQDVSVGIVGAGLAGLACADRLKTAGIRAALYEAASRTGGRCFSLRGFFPGQVAERGGEFIDNLHKTMTGYAQRFNLTLEDVSKEPGDIFYFFDGHHLPESLVVDEFREFVAAMRVDLRRLSNRVTALDHTPADVQLDRTSLLAYLEGDNATGLTAAPIVKEAIIQAYVAEYGLAASEQSCLNFLLFIHADRRSKFTPFGSSDERYHVIDGNDRITEGLASAVAGQLELEMTLVKVRRTPAGRLELTFQRSTQTLVRAHDVAVIAIPFTMLRKVELDASLAIPAPQRQAIETLGYGTNAKMMLGFSARPWAALGSNGGAYADLANLQTTWETNPARARSNQAIITDYSSAARGADLNPLTPQIEAERFLADLDRVYPGAAAAATRIGGQLRVHLEHWPSNPLTQGSYTCYLPGQFTTIAGLEGLPAGNLYFAGEHADAFDSWQGFMEGAALSGIQAATDILRAMKHDRLVA